MASTATAPALEGGLVRLPIDAIRPSPVNQVLYDRRSHDDIRALAISIRDNGLLEPIGVSLDGFILSGHSRHRACRALGMDEVDCRVFGIRSSHPDFARIIVECNRQRAKKFDEVLREILVTHEPNDDAYAALIDHRRARAAVPGAFLDLGDRKGRKSISPAKQPMLRAVQKIVGANRAYWPMSDRSVHYELLNDPPLRHAGKPGSRYRNDPASYKDLCDVLTRARLSGDIAFDAIADPTRPVTAWDLHGGVGGFVEKSLSSFLDGYARDLMQSQPNHIEIVGEKNTVETSIRPVAMDYCIPYTIGRGYCSLDPRRKMFERFRASGKSKLIILVMSDFDPEGEDIALSFAKSMSHDFGLDDAVAARKVCLTHEQALARRLPQTFDIKKSSSRYTKHAAKYGDRAHELEALPAAERSKLLREAIDSVIDVAAFSREQDREKSDAAKLAKLKQQVGPALSEALANQEAD